MNKMLSTISISLLLVMGSFAPFIVYAQQEVDPGTTEDIVSITARAEQSVANILPQSVKDFFAKTFNSIETFRLEQSATATAKRDELKLQLDTAREEQDQATDENRDDVLEGESTSLYEGAGERLPSGSTIGATAKYYAYVVYVFFVSSPVVFYLATSFIAVYIIGTLFNRARRRGGE